MIWAATRAHLSLASLECYNEVRQRTELQSPLLRGDRTIMLGKVCSLRSQQQLDGSLCHGVRFCDFVMLTRCL